MDDELISKKDLLKRTAISYGQLYRWKRKGLIPEDWFIRKSTFTGQETFFPRDKVLARVDKILGMKSEDASLGDIADAVAPNLGEVSLTLAQIRERAIVSGATIDLYAETHDGERCLAMGELVSLWALDALLGTGDVSVEEARGVLATLDSAYPAFEGREADLVVLRKLGVATSLLVTSAAEILLDPKARLVARISLAQSAEALRARIGR
jgi:hypothetical protein